MTDLAFLQRLPLFETLTEQELSEISTMLTIKNYQKGSTLFWEKEEGNELFIIRSGAVKIYRQEDSREIILALFNEGDFFGEMAMFGDNHVRSASANTLEKTTVYILKRDDFLYLLAKSPDIFIKILNTTLERLRRANELIADLAMNSAYPRIARLLIRLLEDHKGKQVVRPKLTHNQIADMTATSRETVTKILSEMQNKGQIEIVNRQIIVSDLGALKSAAAIT
ncbi:Crp/Fnr family transcriptional regulator [Paenibacillaceae bacterium]|nr:Crp/Fnr family transcriptional regulator [Paenibacillaceae bacterium]